jgi:hypothetical protein
VFTIAAIMVIPRRMPSAGPDQAADAPESATRPRS